MKILVTLCNLLLIALLVSCDSSSQEWKAAKESGNIYPKDSFATLKYNILGDSNTLWINYGYLDYKFKEQSNFEVQAIFDSGDSLIKETLKKDTFLIARELLKEFRTKGVAHFVGQSINSEQLTVCLFTEKGLNPIKILFDFPIPNKGKLREDASWSAYTQILNSR